MIPNFIKSIKNRRILAQIYLSQNSSRLSFNIPRTKFCEKISKSAYCETNCNRNGDALRPMRGWAYSARAHRGLKKRQN